VLNLNPSFWNIFNEDANCRAERHLAKHYEVEELFLENLSAKLALFES